jgi:hypothetical protein
MDIDEHALDLPTTPAVSEGDARPHHSSYILRCWTGADGSVRGRLIDAHSGVAHPVGGLDELPQLLRRLLEE